MAGVVKHQTGQEMAEGGPGSGLMTALVREHRLDALEQVPIKDRLLFARADLPLVVDLADVKKRLRSRWNKAPQPNATPPRVTPVLR